MSRLPSKKRPTRNSEKTKATLLDVAIEEFAEKGFHGVTVDQIVERAGFNKRMLYYYFGSKEDIYRAAIVAVYNRLESVELAAVEKGRSPIEKLRRVFHAYFKFNADNPQFTKLILWENLNQGRAIAGQERLLQKSPFMERFKAIIHEGIDQGIFRPKLDMRHLLIQIIGLSFIYSSNAFTLSQALEMDLSSKSVLQKAERQAMDLFLNGLVVDNH